MKLRPDASDKKAIEKLKQFTNNTTSSKAIMHAVHHFETTCQKLIRSEEALTARINELDAVQCQWRDLRETQFLLDGLCGFHHPHRNIETRKKKGAKAQ